MRRRLFALAFALTMLLAVSVTPALAYTATGKLDSVHCKTTWTVQSTYRGTNTAVMTYHPAVPTDPYARCGSLQVEMKYLWSTSDTYMKYAQNTVEVKYPKTTSYSAKVVVENAWCVSVRFWILVGAGANRTTDWIAC